MKILVLGGGGMLGLCVGEAARSRSWQAVAASRDDVDITDFEAVEAALSEDLDAVVNCAAFTRVDDCEEHEELASEVNGAAVGRLAAACARRSLRLVHVSSDYVFAGDASRPYAEDDATSPRSAYGRSKELGERLALEQGARVVRASWLFGPGGPNFVATMLRLADRGGPVRVVDDQVGLPTYTPFLATALLEVAERPDAPAVLHYANPPAVSWHGFARSIFEVFGRSVDLAPCTTQEFPRPAPRPAFSVLDTSRWQRFSGAAPPSWRDGLVDYRRRLEGEAA